MPTLRSRRFSVQTKVLVPVLVFLVLVPTVTVWMVNQRMTEQMLADSRRAIDTAQTVLGKLIEIRANDLLGRYRNEAADANFRGLITLRDTPTMNFYLRDMLDKYPDEEVAVLLNERGEQFAWSRKDASIDTREFTAKVEEFAMAVLYGEGGTGCVSIDGRVYLVVAVPVAISNRGPPEWVLVVANRLGEKAAQEFKAITNTEIVILADETHVAASTLSNGQGNAALLEDAAQAAGDPANRGVQHPLVLGEEHFLVQMGSQRYGQGRGGFDYFLVLSYQDRLTALADTRHTLVMVGLAGIILSSLVVAGLVRRFILPLRELAEAAEAVGRGDFTRKLIHLSNDECGDLAKAFNRMTTSLESSRQQLESTVETLRTTQQQLVQSEKLSAVGQFVAGVAHELNNPLTSVIGFADLLSQVSKDEKARPHLELIAKSAHRCHKIVQSLLSFARQHKPERKLVRINAVVEEVLEIMAYDLRTSNIEVVREFGAQLPEIMADAHQLQQVFVNILSNARQALLTHRQDGRITVTTSLNRNFVTVAFADNGPGISPENLHKIFDPFFTTKPVGKGTGLGLSLSYGIISEHGGRIRAESKLEHGTTFFIELPVAEAQLPAVKPEPVAPAEPDVPTGVGKTALVVDDEEWILELAKAVLQNDGYKVVTVHSGDKAVEAMNHMDFDIIITDWKMPGMNGLQLYEYILGAKPLLARRVLFMSGDVINDVFEGFLRRHKKNCLPKPFELADLRRVVAELAAN